jgi:hypothetical protein
MHQRGRKQRRTGRKGTGTETEALIGSTGGGTIVIMIAMTTGNVDGIDETAAEARRERGVHLLTEENASAPSRAAVRKAMKIAETAAGTLIKEGSKGAGAGVRAEGERTGTDNQAEAESNTRTEGSGMMLGRIYIPHSLKNSLSTLNTGGNMRSGLCFYGNPVASSLLQKALTHSISSGAQNDNMHFEDLTVANQFKVTVFTSESSYMFQAQDCSSSC